MENVPNASKSASSSKKIIFFLVIVIIILTLILVGIGGYFLGQKSSQSKDQPSETQITQSPTSPAQKPIDPSPIPTIDEKLTIKQAVKTALIAEHGAQANSLDITVSKVNGNFASGGAADEQGIGGGMWFAAKVNNDWKLVWDGNGTISCTNLKPYPDYPNTMIPECWDDTTQESIKR